jgi:hypothetical protein
MPIPTRLRLPVSPLLLLPLVPLLIGVAGCTEAKLSTGRGREHRVELPPLASRSADAVGRGAADYTAKAPPVSEAAGDAASERAPSTPTAQARAGQDIPERLSDGDTAPAMIIRTGTASVEVDSLEPAVARLQELVRRVGGYVGNTAMQAGRDQTRSATLELKVPAPRFDELVRGLRPVGRVEFVNVSAEDVGEEYVDVSARVANARRLEDRLVGLLATRTGKLGDVLEIERELARVRESIDRYEGRLRFLRSRAALSTLSVTVHEPAPVIGEPGSRPILDAFREAWRNFVGFVAWLIAASGVLVPVALIAWGVIFLVRRHWKR